MPEVEDRLYTFDTVVDVVQTVLDMEPSEWIKENTRKAIIEVCPELVSEYAGGCEVA